MCGSGCCDNKDDDDEKFDLSNPSRTRGCTDIIPLLLFIGFWVGMAYIAAYSICNGDAFRLVYGYDSFGNTCDESNSDKKIENVSLSGMNLKGRQYVFFMDVYHPDKSMEICVNACPEDELHDMSEVQTFSEQTGSHLCRYDVPLNEYKEDKSGIRGPCPITPVPAMVPLLNRCVPKYLANPAMKDKISAIIHYINDSDVFQKVLGDLYNCWQEMLALCFISLGFSILMILLLRFLAKVIVWIILAVSIIGSIVATSMLWWTYATFKEDLDEQERMKIPLLDVEINGETAFLVYSIIATVLTLLLLLVILVMRKRISLVVALFEEASSCLGSVPCLLIQPIWTYLLLLIFFIYWVAILAYMVTSTRPEADKHGSIRYIKHDAVAYMWWYHVIGLIWTSEFLVACQQIIISGAVAKWYFRSKKEYSFPICDSLYKTILYHLGTAAYGSLVITIVKFPRWVLTYINKKLKNSQNDCAQFCLKCCICCLWCVETCLRYLNANAYTIVAIRGKGFCWSARKAFMLLLSNALRVTAINTVGDFILFLGKIGITASTAAVGTLWLTSSRPDLHFFAIPVLLTCVFAFFVAHCFLSIYEMVVDALLLCFVNDDEINDGSDERPYHASTSLRKYMADGGKNFKKLDGVDGDEETEPVTREDDDS